MTLEMGLKTYSTKNVIISIGAVPILSGFAPDSKISVSTDNDLYTHTADIDGLVNVRSRNNDRVVTITLKLMQGAQANDLLESYHTADKSNNSGTFAFTMSEVGGKSVVTSSMAYIIKDPDLSYDKEVGVHEWTIRAIMPTRLTGSGNGATLISPSNLITPV